MTDIGQSELLLPKDIEPKENRLGIFADDQKGRAKLYSRPFVGIKGFTPIIIDKGTDFEARIKLDDVNLNHVEIAIIEEFYDNYYLREYMLGFVKRLRSANPKAFVIETGAIAGRGPDQIYQDSNRVVSTIDMIDIASNLERTPPNLKARVNALKTLTVQGFVEAGRADDRNKPYSVSQGLKNATRNSDFSSVLEMLSVSNHDFNNKLQILTEEKQRDAMHNLWSIIGHLQMGNSQDDYGMSLDRLKRLITIKPIVVDDALSKMAGSAKKSTA